MQLSLAKTEDQKDEQQVKHDEKFWSLLTAVFEHFEYHDITSGGVRSDVEEFQYKSSNDEVRLVHVHYFGIVLSKQTFSAFA